MAVLVSLSFVVVTGLTPVYVWLFLVTVDQWQMGSYLMVAVSGIYLAVPAMVVVKWGPTFQRWSFGHLIIGALMFLATIWFSAIVLSAALSVV